MNTATRLLDAQSLSIAKPSSRITGTQWGVSALILALLLSAFAIVYTKDLNRRLFIQYQGLQQEKIQTQVEWSKLMLEESTWSAQSRIQQIAQAKLKMQAPSAKETILVQDPAESDA